MIGYLSARAAPSPDWSAAPGSFLLPIKDIWTRELNQAKATISRQREQIFRYEASQREIASLRQDISSLRQRYSSMSSRSGSARISQDKIL